MARSAKIERIDEIKASFLEEMAVLRKRQRDLLKQVMARLDDEKSEQIKRDLNRKS